MRRFPKTAGFVVLICFVSSCSHSAPRDAPTDDKESQTTGEDDQGRSQMQKSLSAKLKLSRDWQEQPVTEPVHDATGRRQILVAETKQGWGNLIIETCKPIEDRPYLESSLEDLKAQLRQHSFSPVELSYLEHEGIPVIKVTGICEAENSVFIHYLLAFTSETLLVTGTFSVDHPEGKTDLLRFVEPLGHANQIVLKQGPRLYGKRSGA